MKYAVPIVLVVAVVVAVFVLRPAPEPPAPEPAVPAPAADLASEPQAPIPTRRPDPDAPMPVIPELPIPDHPVFGQWDRQADIDSLQGVWHVRERMGEPLAVWTTEGTQVIVERANETVAYELKMASPGAVYLVAPGEDVVSVSYARADDGTLRMGPYPAGAFVDGKYVIFDGEFHLVGDENGCETWEFVHENWQRSGLDYRCVYNPDSDPPTLRFGRASLVQGDGTEDGIGWVEVRVEGRGIWAWDLEPELAYRPEDAPVFGGDPLPPGLPTYHPRAAEFGQGPGVQPDALPGE